MSRATGYRHGKPDEKPKRRSAANRARMMGAPSLRTHQRVERVMAADIQLARLMTDGWCKPGQADQIIAHPSLHRHFRRWLKADEAGNSEVAEAEMRALVTKMAAIKERL